MAFLKPAGNFTLRAWLDEKTTLEHPVTLKVGQMLRMDFPGTRLAASRWRAAKPLSDPE
jgi:hypothetical protein